LTDIADLLAQASEVDADIIKFVWPGMLLDSLQPVLSELLTHPKIPIVGLPIGYGARMFGVLARKLNAPWIYAALEQGMEIYDGMPTVRELEEKYRIREVTPQTRFIGVVGFGETRERLLQAFNAGFQELDINFRALPLEVGPVDTLKRQLEQLEIPALIATPGMGDYILPLVDHPEPAAALPRHVDLLLQKRDGWHGYNLLWRSLLKVVERMLHRQHPAPLSLENTRNLVIGGGPVARSILFGLKQLKGTSLLTIPGAQDEVAFCPGCGEALVPESSPDDIAAALDSRAIPYRDIISTRPDVLFLADAGLRPGFQPHALNPLYLQPPLVVVDAMSMFQESDLLSEARARGCHVVRPRYVLGEYLSATFRAISGKDLPDAAFQHAMEIT
jgi:3-dehydroquinate dehydratase / shikimate dehydrogenase